MQKKIFLGMLGLALILTGCEVGKKEVMKKKYVLIAQNVESMACSFLTMDYIIDEFGLVGSNYHEDSNAGATCEDYGKEKGKTCDIKTLKPGNKGYGGSACAIGADGLNGGQDENATKAKKNILIVTDIIPDACGKIAIKTIADEQGYTGDLSFYGDTTNHTTCSDFPGTPCKDAVVDAEKYPAAHGSTTCIVGTDTPPR